MCVSLNQTAEMPGFYGSGEYDVAGFAVGAVKKDELIDGKNIAKGDILLGLKSTGIHSNGFSLVRKVLEVRMMQCAIDNLLNIFSVLLKHSKGLFCCFR